MPEKSNVYQQKESPGVFGMPRRSLDDPVSKASSALGSTLIDVATKQQERHDSAVVQDAVNTLRDKARTNMSTLMERKGADAKGTMGEHKNWYRKEVGKASRPLNNAQTITFKQAAEQAKAHDLDNLAMHQANEHRAHIRASLTATVATAEQEAILHPFNDSLIEAQLENVREAWKRAYPGRDNSAKIEETEAGIKVAALQEMVKIDPRKARIYLEKWKDSLGGAYDKAQEIVEREALLVEARLVAEKLERPNDFDFMEDFVAKEEGITEDVRRAVIKRIRADEAEQKARDAEAKKDRRTEGYNAFWTAMDKKNYGDAQKVVDGWDGEDFTVKERVVAGTVIQKSGVTLKSDPYVERELHMEITSGKITNADQLYADKRIAKLTTEDIRKLENDIKLDPSKKSRTQRYHQMLKRLQTSKVFDGDKRQNEFVYGQKANQLDNFFIKNPKAKDSEVEQFFKDLTAEEKSGYIQQILDFFSLGGLLESGGGIDEPAGELRVIQTGTTKDGRKVRKFNDGSVSYAD